jgi:7-carboxy-7-deazaguanine synthase
MGSLKARDEVTNPLPVVPDASERKLFMPITEMYCDVLQGEGSTVGTPCSFLRFTGCDLECSWCDSKHTWKPGQIVTTRKSVQEVVKFLRAGKARKLVFTGGEPMLHQDKTYFGELIKLLDEGYNWEYEMETNGLHVPNSIVSELAQQGRFQINCSPKLMNAGMGDLSDKYVQAGAFPKIWALAGIFKFVIKDKADLDEALALMNKVFHFPVTTSPAYRSQIYLMPEGETRELQLERLPLVYDLAASYGLNFSPRLHVLRHDNAKAV